MQKFSGMRYFRLGRHIEMTRDAGPGKDDVLDSVEICATLCDEINLRLSSKLIRERIVNKFKDGVIPIKR